MVLTTSKTGPADEMYTYVTKDSTHPGRDVDAAPALHPVPVGGDVRVEHRVDTPRQPQPHACAAPPPNNGKMSNHITVTGFISSQHSTIVARKNTPLGKCGLKAEYCGPQCRVAYRRSAGRSRRCTSRSRQSTRPRCASTWTGSTSSAPLCSRLHQSK